MSPFKLAIIGECMVELQHTEQGLRQSFGGDSLNTAVYFTRLTREKDFTTAYVTALGQDRFSLDMLTAWQSEGIDTRLVRRFDDKSPGLYYIDTDDSGERSFTYWRNDAAAKYLFDPDRIGDLSEQLLEFNAWYLSGISLAILTDIGRQTLFELMARFVDAGGKVYFDNNYRPKLWASDEQAQQAYAQVLALTDTALLTFDDEQLLYGDSEEQQCIARTQEFGVREIIIKRGGESALVVLDQQMDSVAPAPVEKIVDTTAAGDSFSGGYLARRLTQGSAVESAQFGHRVAGQVIQTKGALIPPAAMQSVQL